MLQFVQRLMKPLVCNSGLLRTCRTHPRALEVSPLNSLNQLEELSLVLCAPLTRGFLEAGKAAPKTDGVLRSHSVSSQRHRQPWHIS